ncbi:hypothetical protein O9H85_23775 [Paenibacillus filicis]|uniref:Spore germination GerAC-like C-terminal domain-containing protein n=1 Tax=Paenibacillus gyeongsangnamensis TaxID=3388067 RepID=A0ABT4QER6_9BACL|nr:Ger(x)C family spore germination C-terminal domain-containing protein [Paenibacillus filicis]MCZ8515374.1 hypothetical protein [Paenibacillus filicis]
MYEKGETPSISEIKKDYEVKLTGSTQLDHTGKYAVSLDMQETIILHILQQNAKKSVSLTFSIPGEPKKRGRFDADKITIEAEKIKTKVKTSYRQDKFQFDIHVTMPAALTERLFAYDVRRKGNQLENMISEQAQKQIKSLIKKIQKHHIDPIGLVSMDGHMNMTSIRKWKIIGAMHSPKRISTLR